MKNLLTKASLLVALMSSVASAVEVNTFDESPSLHGLKLAVIKDAVGSNEIVSGDYISGLNKISGLPEKSLTAYDVAMGACVANIKLNELSKANAACSTAIDAINAIKGRGRHREYLKSIAYSNRAIVRYLSDDSSGALADFTNALLVDNNKVVKGNIAILKRIQLHADENTSETSYIAE